MPATAAPATATAAACPYPGLRPFGEREANLFFGREPEIARVVTMLEDHQLVVVHGASGCGKSSVVRAGVVPLFRLDVMASDRTSRVVILRPGDPGGPLLALARKLDAELPRTAPDASEAAPAGLPLGHFWSTTLAASPDWQTDIAAAAAAAGITLLLIVDQFEEIFAAAQGCFAAESARLVQFLTGLGEAAAEGTGLGERSLSVVLTMRSDYLGNCAQWEGFAEAVNRCQYLLPRLSTYGALRSIHEPARRAGGQIADGVADRLLAVIARELDGLPILQHALMRAWRHADARGDGPPLVDLDALAAVGGADHALSRHADEVVRGLVATDPRLDGTIDWVFRSLSDLDTDTRIIRRSISVRQLGVETGADLADIRRIVEAFRRPEHSLVSPFAPDPLEDESIVTVGHEALLRQWNRISDRTYVEGRPGGLVFHEFQDGLIWRSLAVQAEDFARDGTNVLGAAATEQRLPWYREIARRPGWITRHLVTSGSGPVDVKGQWERVAAFMRASEANLVRERRRNSKVQLAIVAMFSLLLVALVYAAYQKNLGKNRMLEAQRRVVAAQQRIVDSATSELQIQNRISTAFALAVKYCSARTPDAAYDRSCVKNMADHYFQTMTRRPASAGVGRLLVPQSPYRAGGAVGPIPQGDRP